VFDGQTVKVIIPALNEAVSVAHILAAIPDWIDRSAVADGGSSDQTVMLARQAGALVVTCEPGRARGYRLIGPLRTTLINQLIIAGVFFGVPYHWLTRLYHYEQSSPTPDR